MAGSLGDLGGLLKQARKMQRQVKEIRKDLEKKTFEGSAGSGAVVAVVNGSRRLVSLKINPEIVDPKDVKLLEEIVATAVADAFKQAGDASEAAMKGVTGGMGLPGMS
jgi:DNA-binding YbaB/EbfC family protein